MVRFSRLRNFLSQLCNLLTIVWTHLGRLTTQRAISLEIGVLLHHRRSFSLATSASLTFHSDLVHHLELVPVTFTVIVVMVAMVVMMSMVDHHIATVASCDHRVLQGRITDSARASTTVLVVRQTWIAIGCDLWQS